MEASKYQKAIEAFVAAGKGNGIVGAVAGSGKTTTLVNFVAPAISGNGVFLAFNKAIATELGDRLPSHFQSRTIHSLAFGAVKSRYKRAKVNAQKYKNIIAEYVADMPYASNAVIDAQDSGEIYIQKPLARLVDLARNTLTCVEDVDALFDLAHHHQIELPDDEECEQYVLESVKRIAKEGRNVAALEIDFTDMLWLCATDEKIWPRKSEWILVDECQDLSKAQLAVVKKAAKRGSRFLFVGDPRQAINGFAGADCDSFANIEDTMRCERLPLSICYRCPSSHVELAKEIVPEIEAREGAPEGVIDHCKADDVAGKLIEGDMLICRTNSPLVSLCFTLIADGKPARIKGRNIGEGLVTAAKKIAKRRDFLGWQMFGESVDLWSDRETNKLLKRNGGDDEDIRIQNIQDKAMCLRIIWARGDAQSIRDFESTVNDIFSDDTPGIQLSSIHRSKGLEADRVFIYDPSLLPGPWAQPGTWQYEQEMNLKYVALTRSKNYLCFVEK